METVKEQANNEILMDPPLYLQVINFYMNMLVERSKSPHLPSVYTFNTFFFPKLRSSGYSTVRRWTKKVDIFSVDIILVPVHLGVHWCLSVSHSVVRQMKTSCFHLEPVLLCSGMLK